MKIIDLDLKAIFDMLQKENNQERIDDLVAKILEYYEKVREIYDVYRCLKDIRINDELLNKYKTNGNVLYFLAIEGAEPHKKICSMAIKVCNVNQVRDLCEKYFIPIECYEDKIIESRCPIFYANALKKYDKYVMYGMNYNRLREEFIKLPVEKVYESDYYATILLMLEKLDFNSKCNKLLIEILIENSYQDALNFVCKMLNFKDFTSKLKAREDWLYLFEYLKKYCEYNNNRYSISEDRYNYNRISDYLNTLQNYKNNILNEIMNGKITDIAWQIKVLDINNEELVKILNYWAREGKALEFDLYFNYLSVSTFEYENIGKHIDEKYQNIMESKTQEKGKGLTKVEGVN